MNYDRELTEHARLFASNKHQNSRPYGKLPYITHPAAVAKLLAPYGPEAVAAGWLHDTVEDTDATLDQLRTEGFPDAVVTAVDGVTRRENETYFDFVRRAASTSWMSRIVKLADNVHNSSGLDQAEDRLWAAGMSKRYRRARQILEHGLVAEVAALEGFTTVGKLRVAHLDSSEGPNSWIALGHHDHTAMLDACQAAAKQASYPTLFGNDVPAQFVPGPIRIGSGYAIYTGGGPKNWNITTIAVDHTGMFRPITVDTVGVFAVTWIENP
jgi:hypothetical protein